MEPRRESLLHLATRAARTPWRAANEIRRVASVPYIRLQFALAGLRWGKRWRIFGTPILQVYRGSKVTLGDGLSMRSWETTNALTVLHPVTLATLNGNAEIIIGDDCGFTGTTIVSAESVQLGDRVLVGANVTIADTDFHPIDPETRLRDMRAGKTAPIRIADDVFIGMNSLILKGVTIGKGATIGAGSVVTKDVPEGCVVAGNPARIVRKPA